MKSQKRFLLVDDDDDDVGIFKEALAETMPDAVCDAAENGKHAFEFLSSAKNLPDIIFLDINMPIMNGWEFLKKLKADLAYRAIPVIMYSTSSAKKDIEMAYALGAELFLTKPDYLKQLCAILGIVTSPQPESWRSRLEGFENVKPKPAG